MSARQHASLAGVVVAAVLQLAGTAAAAAQAGTAVAAQAGTGGAATEAGTGSAPGASPLPDAATVVARVNSRERGISTVQHFAITLAGRSGSSRERRLSAYRRVTDAEDQSVLFFTSPASIDGTGLLVRDYHAQGRPDGLWLYLPALRTVRRISPGNRGQDFFGTDFTLLEVSTDTRLRDDLLRLSVTGRDEVDGQPCLRVDALPKDADLEREVGYSRAEYCIDERSWIPRRIVLRGAAGVALKKIRFDDLREEGGIWTVYRRSAEVAGSGRRTVFETVGVRYGVELPESLFSESGLTHGPPASIGTSRP